MKFQKRFGNRKRSNPKKGLFLIVLLAIALYLFFNAEKILGRLL
ncbi:hypothetical protein [Tenacibaculum agarivorans]|nr:hypothetical protein [Tenacibaculum agarivorans]